MKTFLLSLATFAPFVEWEGQELKFQISCASRLLSSRLLFQLCLKLTFCSLPPFGWLYSLGWDAADTIGRVPIWSMQCVLNDRAGGQLNVQSSLSVKYA